MHRDQRFEEIPYASPERVVRVEARKFEFSPSQVRAHAGEALILELVSSDVEHGFAIPELGVSARISPGKSRRIRVVATRAGTYDFHCDVFCGSGHEGMSGQLIVE